MAWERHSAAADGISGDRRRDRRYQLRLDLWWKLIRRRRVLDTGIGHTVDLSSGGILFDDGRTLPEGLNVELSLMWPVLLHNVAPMQLVVLGRIKRTAGRRIAIQTVQHEFRTAGVSAEHRNVVVVPTRNNPAILSTPAVLGALGKLWRSAIFVALPAILACAQSSVTETGIGKIYRLRIPLDGLH
jgi:hypothetical protein